MRRNGAEVIPEVILAAIAKAALPCFVFDAATIRQRAALVVGLVDRYFFPIKAAAELEIIRAAVLAGSGLDLCSAGDAALAAAAGCPGDRWKFTSACASASRLAELVNAGALLDADSSEQALEWRKQGGRRCGLRITAGSPNALYRGKFGLPAPAIAGVARELSAAGVQVEGLHLHDQHANLTPAEYAGRVAETLEAVEPGILRECRYVNIGGSWPMRHGSAASAEEMGAALRTLRERLSTHGFAGEIYAEPGRWVVGPCGYWAARVAAVKAHPQGSEHRIVVLDTNTPVPCRPSLASFAVVRDGFLVKEPRAWTCDLFGSANTALDSIGLGIRLPELTVGEVVVALGHGAYTRSLIPPFNERERPGAIVVGG